ncbi:uncharacterized protein CANTADRAFT_20613 [Suhomyces tanzawaensis NRRL Y-17324]|uniref:Ubiquitin-like 1-activating enzyme E1A n=1 Tax=Suhomyces tanzawaensis NRRL Y-17324 TaxID=984487 RepID=A0A1E4SNG7_9ASCO|nr:uncharacterized protein CANTADRAFT_20613 [Suhomyces tanzawaensis NRRL Y-17324]ODV81069.1 hypothetical protein CANTADRAFT_20613 [Suhomyces tanzawaensis NRRL Y-17324]
MSKDEALTADEIALYDRQIRLWGMATQLRLRSAKVLIVNVGGVGTEIVKNLVLGGLNSIELLDSSVVKEEDFAAQFFLPNDDSIIGQPKLPIIVEKIKELNNRVKLNINTTPLESIFEDPSYFKQFDLIIATELNRSQLFALNQHTRALSIPLYATGLHGLFGYIITDLIEHYSTPQKEAGNQLREPNTKINRSKTITKVDFDKGSNTETLTILDEFVPIPQIFKSKELPNQLNKRQLKRLSASFPLIFSLFEFEKPLNPEDVIDKELLRAKGIQLCEQYGIPTASITEEYLDMFSNQAFTEYSPVAAVLGGTLAQDVIQFLSKKESPINNVLILDSVKSEMPIYLL